MPAKKKFVDACAEKVIAEYAARGEKVLSVPVGGQTVVGSARLCSGSAGDHAADGGTGHRRQVSGGRLWLHRYLCWPVGRSQVL